MTDQVIKKNERNALWLAVAICVAPLVPYAIIGAGGS